MQDSVLPIPPTNSLMKNLGLHTEYEQVPRNSFLQTKTKNEVELKTLLRDIIVPLPPS